MAKEKAACSNNNSSKPPARPPPTKLHDIPDKLLELILINLTSSLHLVRAAATCRRWRRIITRRNFLVSIDRPPPHPLAGHYHHRLHPPPSNPKPHITFVPSSPDQLPLTGSLDFLPGGGGISRWEIVDSRGSLLLLSKKESGSRTRRRLFPDLVVCEPVTRRYKAIPRMEEMKHHHCLRAFLLDADDHSIAMFRVTCVVYCPYIGVSEDVGTVRVCEYREDVWNWTRYMKPINDFEPPRLFEWYIVTETRAAGCKRGIHLHGRDSLRFLGHAEGCVFWAIREQDDSLLVLNDYMSDFDIFRLPDGMRGSEVQAIVDGNGEHDNVRIVSLEGDILRVVNWMYNFDEILLEKSLNLVEATCRLQGYKEGYFHSGAKVITVSTSAAIVTPAEETWMVSVDLETMEVAECKYASVAYPCELPWPPTLRACPVQCNRWGYGRCSHICVC